MNLNFNNKDKHIMHSIEKEMYCTLGTRICPSLSPRATLLVLRVSHLMTYFVSAINLLRFAHDRSKFSIFCLKKTILIYVAIFECIELKLHLSEYRQAYSA